MSLAKHKKKIILADRMSGIEAIAFVGSILPYVIENTNERVKFKFPFWAFSSQKGSNYGTEWGNNIAYQKVTNSILSFIKTARGLDYFRQLKKKIIQEEKILEKTAQILKGNLANFSDRELVKQYEKFIKQYSYYYGLGGITFLYENILSDKLIQSLTKRYPQLVKFLPQLFSSSYRSFMLLSEDNLWRIKQERNQRRRQLLIQQYLKDFFYLRASYIKAPIITEKFVLKQIKNLKKPEVKKFLFIPSAIKLEFWEKRVIALLKISEVIRDKRKQINMIGSYMMFNFLAEVTRRRSISKKLAMRAFWFEYKDLVLNTNQILLLLKRRQEFSLVYDGQQSFYYNYIAIRERVKPNLSTKNFLGTPAASGLYRGKVRLVLSTKDLSSFYLGEVLVADMTRPEFLPAMKKAGAIITDEGGLTCHAAIIARELKKPCIVGTKIATKILKNGDLVEVNADQGMVKIINNLKE